MAPEQFDDVEACVDAIIDRVGPEIVLGTPLGIGKANHVVNELVDRAVEDPGIELDIWTALTLTKPSGTNALDTRLVEPMAERIFGDYPDLEYASMLKDDDLPDNIELHEFYFPPGEYLRSTTAQQSVRSVNYTHVLREIRRAGINVLVQLVGEGTIDGEHYYNLSSNADLSADLIPYLREQIDEGDGDGMIVGQVNRNLPFMYGDAPQPPEHFDAILDDAAYEFPLFAPPNLPVNTRDHLIGLRVSSLVADGGTVQIGIGSLGDAIAWAMQLRHEQNDAYRELLETFEAIEDARDLIASAGGLEPFDEGLYGGTEMFVEAFLHLIDSGIVDREVYDDAALQRTVNRGLAGPDRVDLEALDALVEEGAIDGQLTADDVRYLKDYGVLDEDVEWRNGKLDIEGRRVAPDLADDETRELLAEEGLGGGLEGGQLLHAGFFMGPRSFYESLCEMDEDLRRKLGMRSVMFTNHLYHHEELNRAQRLDARLINTGMKATVSGAVVSDGLEDNRVVSGVGGQFNFVNMAHELEGGRSIIMIRATRESEGTVESNIVWNYGHITIPRHLRDIIVTEYGVADLRGRPDAEVVAEMIKIADSRFQDELVEKAKSAGKLPDDWDVPPPYRNNTPEALDEWAEQVPDDLLPPFPYGTDMTETELDLARALRELKEKVEGREWRDLADTHSIPTALSIPDEADPYLERMDLDAPSGATERALRRLTVYALAEAEIL